MTKGDITAVHVNPAAKCKSGGTKVEKSEKNLIAFTLFNIFLDLFVYEGYFEKSPRSS